jgi:hypothetical protein
MARLRIVTRQENESQAQESGEDDLLLAGTERETASE